MLSSNPQKARTKKIGISGVHPEKQVRSPFMKISVWWSICFKQESKVQTPSQRLSSPQLRSGTCLSCLPSSAGHCAPRKGWDLSGKGRIFWSGKPQPRVFLHSVTARCCHLEFRGRDCEGERYRDTWTKMLNDSLV